MTIVTVPVSAHEMLPPNRGVSLARRPRAEVVADMEIRDSALFHAQVDAVQEFRKSHAHAEAPAVPVGGDLYEEYANTVTRRVRDRLAVVFAEVLAGEAPVWPQGPRWRDREGDVWAPVPDQDDPKLLALAEHGGLPIVWEGDETPLADVERFFGPLELVAPGPCPDAVVLVDEAREFAVQAGIGGAL
ncbi:hypothetical protein OG216_47955 (plasmid) [Streptomycetaceae bacterium NBC_01309]